MRWCDKDVSCVESVSAQVMCKSWNEDKKKSIRRGRRKGKKETIPQTPWFWRFAFAHKRSFWLARYGNVDYRAINTSIKPAGMLCLLTSQIKCLDWYLYELCCCEVLSHLSWKEGLASIIISTPPFVLFCFVLFFLAPTLRAREIALPTQSALHRSHENEQTRQYIVAWRGPLLAKFRATNGLTTHNLTFPVFRLLQ